MGGFTRNWGTDGFKSASGAPFNPASIAGLELWLDAAQIAGVNVDGTPVATWTDQSGFADHAVQATGAKQPLFKTAIVNGLPVVRFDGVDDTMLVGAFGADASRTIFIVVKRVGGTGGILGFTDGNSLLRADATNIIYSANQAFAAVTLGPHNGNFVLVTLRVNSAASLDAYLNGGVATNFDPDNGITTTATLRLASDQDLASWGQVDIAQIISYSVPLSDSDLNTVRAAMGSKYGLF